MISAETMQVKIDNAQKQLKEGFDNFDLNEAIQSRLTQEQARYIESIWGGMDGHSVWLDAVKEIAEPGRWKRIHR